MAVITVDDATQDGTEVTFVAAAGGGDTFANDGLTTFVIKNGGGGAITPTFDSTVNCNQGFDHDAGASLGAGADGYFGPFPVERFGSTVSVTYSGVTSVTVAAVRVKP